MEMDFTENIGSKGEQIMAKLPGKLWHKAVKFREDLSTGELSLASCAADLYAVIMQREKRQACEKPENTCPEIPIHTKWPMDRKIKSGCSKNVVIRHQNRSICLLPGQKDNGYKMASDKGFSSVYGLLRNPYGRNGIQEVVGSIPFSSTIIFKHLEVFSLS